MDNSTKHFIELLKELEPQNRLFLAALMQTITEHEPKRCKCIDFEKIEQIQDKRAHQRRRDIVLIRQAEECGNE